MKASEAHSNKTAAMIWWIIWFAILGGLVIIYVVLGQRPTGGPDPGGSNAAMDYLGIAPLVVSSILRWLVLPKVAQPGPAFAVFVIGLALAEGCGILGIFLSSRPTELFLLGVLGLLQWAPVFAGRRVSGGAAAAGRP